MSDSYFLYDNPSYKVTHMDIIGTVDTLTHSKLDAHHPWMSSVKGTK